MCVLEMLAQAGGLFGDGHRGRDTEDEWKRNEVGLSTLVLKKFIFPAVSGT